MFKKKHSGGRLPIPPRRNYEGSAADKRQDKAGAKKAGMSLKNYENSPQDMAEDAAGNGPGRPATTPGPNTFSPRQEKNMRTQARQARLAPLPPDNDADDMDAM